MPPTVPDLPAFDLKSRAWTLTVLRLHTADPAALSDALANSTAEAPGLFEREPVLLDLTSLADEERALDLPGLLAALRAQGMLPVAVQGGTAQQHAQALDLGLAEAAAALPRVQSPVGSETTGDVGAAPDAVDAGDSGHAADAGADAADPAGSFVPEAGGASAVAAIAQEAEPLSAPDDSLTAALRRGNTLVVDTPLRSGQRVYARGGDLVVLSAVSFGAEVIADGHIHVYGPLRGRAIAGASGDVTARIFSTAMDPQLVSIAGIYRTTEVPFPDEVLGRPAQVCLKGERIVVDALKF